MSAWVLVPCLVALRAEFNEVNPTRDKGADGSIGDTATHTSSSDHTPDEDSDVLRDHDADDKNEVHALDIDSTGPWPDTSFASLVAAVIAGERAKWLDANDKCRLNYVIFDGEIYDKDNDFQPRAYGGSDPHTNHAHFSARYETSCENDTRPWGVAEMPLTSADGVTVWKTDIIPNPDQRPDSASNPATTAFFAMGDMWQLIYNLRDTIAAQGRTIAGMSATLNALSGRDMTDESAIVSGVLAGLDPAAIAAAIPAELAARVADELATRLRS